MTTPAHVQAVLSRLDGVRARGDGWEARCPAHEDQKASLSVGIGDDGRTLLHCHAGCHAADIVQALKFSKHDLFAPRCNDQHKGNGRLGRIVAEYDYRDEQGTVLFEAVRFDPKDFRQRHACPNSKDGNGWTWTLGGNPKKCSCPKIRRVLYRLPELLATDPDQWVFPVEGEKDVENLRERGLVSTTNVGGAGKWRREYNEFLRGRRVCILPDNDEAGHKHAAQVAQSLHSIAREVRILELPGLPEHGDVSDWINAGGTVEKLMEMVEAAPAWEPSEHKHPTKTAALIPENAVVIDKLDISLAQTLAQITNQLVTRGDYYHRAGKLVSITGDDIRAVCTAHELAGELSAIAEVVNVRHKGDNVLHDHIPLPTDYGNCWLNNPLETTRLPKITLFTRNATYDDSFELVRPGFNARSGIYYAGPEITPAHSTEYLDKLLWDFCWRTAGDRTNYVGLMLTPLLIQRFIGTHPAPIFNGNQPGLGKTLLMQLMAILRDGKPADTMTYNPDQAEFEKTLATKIRGGSTTIIIDNAKTSNKSPLIDSPALERCITDPVVSFRLLGQNASIAVENSIIFGVTINFGRFSPDLVSRSVAINLHHEGNPKRRNFQINNLLDWTQAHRTKLLAELCGYVERWKASGRPPAQRLASRFPRWAETIGGILEANRDPDFLDNADASAAEFDPAHSDMVELMEILKGNVNLRCEDVMEHAEKHRLLRSQIGSGSKKSRLTKLGNTLTRFVNEVFVVGPDDNRHPVKLLKEPDPRGKVALYSFLPVEDSP